MPRQFLRKVEGSLWWREELQHWLDQGEVPADCVSDLKTKENTLSVYEVSSDEDAVRAAAALAVQRAGSNPQKSLSDVEAFVFPEHLLRELAIDLAQTKGGTKDVVVNASHFDLVKLSGSKLVLFAFELLRTQSPRTFFHPELLKSLRDTKFPESALTPRMKAQIQSLSDD